MFLIIIPSIIMILILSQVDRDDFSLNYIVQAVTAAAFLRGNSFINNLSKLSASVETSV